jgi:EAL domain-containing protein (putative c-di-GMP-specific phosphodiesterase class I)
MSELSNLVALGEKQYENTVHCIFEQILNPFVDEFAKNLNLKTIAEYVENEEIFKIVKELVSDYSQGYLFSAPIPIPEIFGYNKDMDKNNE